MSTLEVEIDTDFDPKKQEAVAGVAECLDVLTSNACVSPPARGDLPAWA